MSVNVNPGGDASEEVEAVEEETPELVEDETPEAKGKRWWESDKHYSERSKT